MGFWLEMLSRLRIHHLRCLETVEVCPAGPGMITAFVGDNAQGKTSILEGLCLLMRLQSPRAVGWGELARIGGRGFAVEGEYAGRLLRVVMREGKREYWVDGARLARGREYLAESGLVTWMANDDIQLVRGGGEGRRRFLDFAASQVFPDYLPALRRYERALRARNYLLKSAGAVAGELDAYSRVLLAEGVVLTAARQALCGRLQPELARAQGVVSGSGEELEMVYIDGSRGDFAAALEQSEAEEKRRKMTLRGPHRDDFQLRLNGMEAGRYASEGQQRTIALSLKLGQSRVLGDVGEHQPLLLMDDIFGELDPDRRRRLLAFLPADALVLVTATSLEWADAEMRDRLQVMRVAGGNLLR